MISDWKHDFKVGDRVIFGRPNGEQTEGTVTKVNAVSLKVQTDDARGTYHAGTLWRVAPSLCRKVGVAPVAPAVPKAKRPESEILSDIRAAYSGISPENLWMDGEATKAEATRRAAVLNRRLKDLFIELGRKVPEDAAFGIATSHYAW